MNYHHGKLKLSNPTRSDWAQLREQIIGRNRPGVLMIDGKPTDGTADKPLDHYGQLPWYIEDGEFYLVEYHGPVGGRKWIKRDEWELLAIVLVSYDRNQTPRFTVGKWEVGFPATKPRSARREKK